MTKKCNILYAALAVAVAFGICGPKTLNAQDATAGPVGHLGQVGQIPVDPADTPDATAATMYMGILGVTNNPPTGGATPSWPCVGGTGDPECSSIAAGGFVVGFSYQLISTDGNGQVYWTFTTTTATGTADFKLTVTQGKTTIFTYSFSDSVTANGLWYAYVSGATLSKTTKGAATVTVTTTVGGKTITGKAAIHIR